MIIINDISYISLYLYIPIHLNIFSDLVKKGCNILTHHVPSNVVYHISETKVLIDGNMLKLLGDKRNIMMNTLVSDILILSKH